jgi:hypothetical protein
VLRFDLPQPRSLDIPGDVRAHQAVLDLAVDRKLLGVHILQAIFLRAPEDEIRRLIELRRSRNAVQSRQGAQIFVRRTTAGLVAQVRPIGIRQEGMLSPCSGGLNHPEKANAYGGKSSNHCKPPIVMPKDSRSAAYSR